LLVNKPLQIIGLASLIVVLVGCGPWHTDAGPTTAAPATPYVTVGSPDDISPSAAATPVGSAPTSSMAGATPVPEATPLIVRTAEDVTRISPAEAWQLLESSWALLIDTRSAEEYRTGHAADAISLPEAEAVRRYAELPTDRTLIFY